MEIILKIFLIKILNYQKWLIKFKMVIMKMKLNLFQKNTKKLGFFEKFFQLFS